MPEVVEAETVAIGNVDHLLGRWGKMVFDQHVRHARFDLLFGICNVSSLNAELPRIERVMPN
jgi:hypothetical protein